MLSYGLKNNGIKYGIDLEHSVNGRRLSDISRSAGQCAECALRAEKKRDKTVAYLVEGLPYVCGYLFIPYGEDGINYVKEKIYPLTLEEFLQTRVEYLLEKTSYLNCPEYPELAQSAFDYCRSFLRRELPAGVVSAVLLAFRLESELVKSPPMSFSYRTPQSEYDRYGEFLDRRAGFFSALSERLSAAPDLTACLRELTDAYSFKQEFEFTDVHRREIDALPIFTSLAK